VNAIDALFSDLKNRHRKAFIPFLTAGDPDLQTIPALARATVEGGADLLEIGFPYSDPIADGPVIQASYTRALARGIHLDDVFACARRIADEQPRLPLAAMVSFSLVHRRGAERFVEQARASGFSGAIVPDLPLEEAAGLGEVCRARDFRLIHLVTPTTSAERARKIARDSTGFLYCVSVAGLTGERAALPEELIGQLRWLREQTTLPLCVGFGISKPEHVRALREHVDGIIVGSAVVRQVEAGQTTADRCARVKELCRGLAGALNEALP
jgi:tryptophan synthase alpha chain